MLGQFHEVSRTGVGDLGERRHAEPGADSFGAGPFIRSIGPGIWTAVDGSYWKGGCAIRNGVSAVSGGYTPLVDA